MNEQSRRRIRKGEINDHLALMQGVSLPVNRCAPDSAPQAVRSSEHCGAAHTGPHGWSPPTVFSPCREDPRVKAARQSSRMSSPRPTASARIAIAKDLGVCADFVADGLGLSSASVPRRPDRKRASRCRQARGSRCWALMATPKPLPTTNGHVRGPDSRFHVLRHSCVDRISFAWQHPSPSGREVLHLELELSSYCQEHGRAKTMTNLRTPITSTTDIQPRSSF